jgi:hypothetical protein
MGILRPSTKPLSPPGGFHLAVFTLLHHDEKFQKTAIRSSTPQNLTLDFGPFDDRKPFVHDGRWGILSFDEGQFASKLSSVFFAIP